MNEYNPALYALQFAETDNHTGTRTKNGNGIYLGCDDKKVAEQSYTDDGELLHGVIEFYSAHDFNELQSRLESLEQELKYRNEACIGLNDVIQRMAEDNIKRCGQMESLEKDAARYQWLRNETAIIASNFTRRSIAIANYEKDEHDCIALDAHIDTAMQANKGE